MDNNRKHTVLLGAVLLTSLSLATFTDVANSVLGQPQIVEAKSKKNKVKSSKKSKKKKTYSIGDKITFDKKIEITVTSAEWTDERNVIEDSNPEKVLKVTYDVTNLSDEDYVVGSELQVYAGGEKMELYPNENTYETISAGRSYQGVTENFGITNDGDIELEFDPGFSYNFDPVVIKLDK